MRYKSSRIGLAVFLSFLFWPSSYAQTSVRVKEDSTRIEFRSSDAVVDLPVENQTRSAINAHVLLELLDTSGTVRAHSEQDANVPPGITKLKSTLSLGFAPTDKRAPAKL